MKKESVPTVLRLSVLASAVSTCLTAAPALAQDPTEEIVVTGSRIVRRDFEANSPILTLDAERFEESGSVAIESVVNQLPQFVPSVGSFSTGVQMGGSGGGFNDQIATGATRTPSQATLSMRGLGPNRNLVLLDGRRAMPINASMAVSINTIPSAAIARIETITGGASSVYGADAVAGVVNFITKRDFEGIDFDVQYGQTTEFSDATEFRFSGVIGANFSDNRGNVLLGFERSEREEVLRANRPYILEAFANPGSNTQGAFWGAAGYSPVSTNMHTRAAVDSIFGPGVITSLNRQFYMNDDGTLYTETADGAHRYDGPWNFPGTNIPWRFADGSRQTPGQLRENLHQANVQSPLSRYSLFGRAHIDLADNISAFAQLMYSESDTKTSADYSPMLGGWRASAPHGQGVYLPSVDANGNTRIDFLAGGRHGLDCPPVGGCTKSQAFPTPPELTTLLDSRPDPEADWEFRQLTKYSGLRRSDAAVTSHQIVAGLQGSLMEGDWSWELYGSTGSTRTLNIYGGTHSLERYRLLMRSPNYGKGLIYQGNQFGGGFASDFIECTSGLGGAYGVSGYTEFFEPSQDCQDALRADGKVAGHKSQNVVEFNLQGGIVDLPAGEMRFAVGTGMRDNDYVFKNDVLNTPESVNDQLGGFFPSGDSGGKTEVREAYGELLVPLLTDKPGVQSLNLELGYRHTDNEPAADINSYKALIDWAVVDRVRLRGGRQIANRAPNIGELFQASEQLAPFTVVQGDPCSDLNPQTRADIVTFTANPNLNTQYAAQVRQLCETLMGPEGAAAFYSNPDRPATLVSARIVNLNGNPNLVPEHAETITFGAVIDVTQNSTLTLDWWNIKIKDMIAPQIGDTIYRQCLNFDTNPTYDPLHPACQQVRRNPTNGGTASTDVTFTNQARVDLAGFDVQYDWGRDIGPGSLNVSFLGTFLDKYEGQEINTATTYDYKGTTGPSAINGVTRFPFDYRTFTTIGYRWGDWSASLRHRYQPSMQHEANVLNGRLIYEPTGSYQVYDATMRYVVNDAMEVRFGIDNLFDVDPEIMFKEVGSGAAGYTNENVTNPVLYDIIGRKFYVGLKMTF